MCFDFYNVIDDFFRSCFKLCTHAVILIHDLGSTKFWHVFFPFPENSPETGSCFDTVNFFLLFHAIILSRFRSALRKQEKNVSPFCVFHYDKKRCVCNVLRIPKGKFGYHAYMTLVFIEHCKRTFSYHNEKRRKVIHFSPVSGEHSGNGTKLLHEKEEKNYRVKTASRFRRVLRKREENMSKLCWS